MEHKSDDERSSVFVGVHRLEKLFYSAGARVALRATAVAVGVITDRGLGSAEKRRHSVR
jgi:hypothetical protein